MLFFIPSQFWVVLSIWDSSQSLFAKILRGSQNPVKSLIIAYPEALKSRIQDNMVLTGTEAAELPTDIWDLAEAGSSYLHWGKCDMWALSVRFRESCQTCTSPVPNLRLLNHSVPLGPNTGFCRHPMGTGIFLAYLKYISLFPEEDRYAGRHGGEEITSQGSRRLSKWPFSYLYCQTPLLIKIFLMNSDTSHLQIKGKQENVVLSGKTQLSGLPGNLHHYPNLNFAWNPLQRVHREYCLIKPWLSAICELNRNQVREVINDICSKVYYLFLFLIILSQLVNVFFMEQLPSQNQYQCTKGINSHQTARKDS